MTRVLLMLLGMFVIAGCDVAQEITEGPGNANQNAANPAPANENVAVEKPKESLLRRKTQLFVDMEKAMEENPDLVVSDNKINATGPITAALEARVTVASRVALIQMQHELDLQFAMNEKYPSFEELQAMIKKYNIEFQDLPPHKSYAYNSSTGKFVILEDPTLK